MKVNFKKKAIALLALSCAFTSAIGIASVSAFAQEDCALTMRNGAAVRIGTTQAGTGIRFYADVDESLLNIEGDVATFKTDDDVTEVGMIIVPAKALENVSGDVFTYLKNTYQASKEEISTQFEDSQIQKDEDGYYVTGAIVKIQDENLDLEYQAIPYTYDGDYTYGAKSEKRTISYVFNQALVDTDEDAMKIKPAVLAKAVEMGTKLDLTAECEISEGLDLSAYTCEGYEIASAQFTGAENVETVTENKIVFADDYSKAGLGKELVITYTNSQTLRINADVWSLYIKTPTDLVTNMKAAAYTVGNNVYGYYKLMNDLQMTVNDSINGQFIASNDAVQRFQGVFEGNGKTVNNLRLRYRSLFGAMGQNCIIKNVNFTNVYYNDGYVDNALGQTAIFGSWVYGGTVENLSVTYNIPLAEKYNTATGATNIPTWCGLLFAQVFPNGRGNCYSINLNNVKIEALNAETSLNTTFAPLGRATKDIGENNAAIFKANNVTITGSEGIYFNANNNVVTEYNGITYKTGKAVKLNAVDTQIGETVDFAALVPAGKTVQSVSYNGAILDGTSASFTEKTDASNVARTYTILTTDGEKYTVDVTVWTLILKENTDFARLKENVEIRKVYYNDTTWSNAYYGYYKLGNDITMKGGTVDRIGTPLAMRSDGATWNSEDGKCYVGINWGFQGVFDGDGHTVSNMDVYHYSIFGVVGKNAVIKNVTFENVDFLDGNTASHRSLFASWMTGGTIENVTVTYNVPSVLKTTAYHGVLFSDCYPFGKGSIYSLQVTLTDVTITALNAKTTDFAAFGVVRNYDANAFKATNVKVYNCASYYNNNTKAMVYSETGIAYGTTL